MIARFGAWFALLAAMAIVIGVALVSAPQPISTHSTFDTGINGFEALFNVLRSEGVPVQRLEQPLALRGPNVSVIAFTSTAPERSVGRALVYDANDYKRLAQFTKAGGRLIYFASGSDDPMLAALKKQKLHVRVLDATRFTNAALAKHPQSIVQAYDAFAGRGVVAFDERLHGYALDRTMWSVMPAAVRLALWVVVLAVLIVLVDANVRFAPPVVQEPPLARDSSAYIVSMARLLRRARARRAAIARFAKSAPRNDELQRLAAVDHPGENALMRAAYLAVHARKEYV